MHVLWRGTWATRARIASGLVLFVYVLTHFLNIGLGLFSDALMERAQDWRQVVTRSLPGFALLYGSLLIHAGLALGKLTLRRTLRMPFAAAVQSVFGLLIPLILLPHIVFTRHAHQAYDVNDEMGFISVLLWGTRDGFWQSLLVVLVWVHGCIGLHYWLRNLSWWRRAGPYLIGVAVLIPAFALAGFMTEGRRIQAAFTDDAARMALLELYNWPDAATFDALIALKDRVILLFLALVAALAAIYGVRKLLAMRTSVRVSYVDGPEVTAQRGLTLLQMSQVNGVPHTSLCGGRGRCTTCRVVIEEGGELLHPPEEAELRSLRAVNASPNTRLACMIRPTAPTTVFRVFRPDGRRSRAHASQGQERRLAILFLDMRGFTARTTGQLPYDVVFLLNRFFDAIVPAITRAGGTVDKYLGDGLLAVFETSDEKSSARAALRAVMGIGAALEQFNATLVSEDATPVKIGVGLHLGELVLGEIGAAGNAPRTIIGDTVNTASRLEARTKEMGVEVLISGTLLQSAGVETEEMTLTALELRGVQAAVPALPVDTAIALGSVLRSHGADWAPTRPT